ncbi:MAG: enoyl-CoA hydratase/isomerase family protein [Chloroflexi bacterium]|nr:enoyl-CoA hydratase/isomerase family protein [Chloroflexota bacterium]
MNAFETVLYDKLPSIALVTLNRPRALNAINIRMRDELWQVIGAVRDDPDVQVVIFRGAGDRAFSAGADITEFGTAPSPVIARQVRWQRDLWGTLASFSKPLIAAIQGYALGAGLELAMCCDIRIASDDSRLGLPETTLGMIPAAGGTQTMPRLIPPAMAAQLCITGEMVAARDALGIGLLNRVVPRDELFPTARKIAEKIIANDQRAVRTAKEAVRRGLDLPLVEGLELERRLRSRLGK